MMRRLAIVTSLLALSACTTAPGPQPVQTNQSLPSAPKTAPGPASAPSLGSDPNAGATAPDQPLDEKVATAKAAYERNPSDTAAKAAYADAALMNANFYMYKSPLPPNQKYPKALALYRDVLTLDPTNATAKQSIETIESIYRSMNRPVPGA
jgi:hypothetical protein